MKDMEAKKVDNLRSNQLDLNGADRDANSQDQDDHRESFHPVEAQKTEANADNVDNDDNGAHGDGNRDGTENEEDSEDEDTDNEESSDVSHSQMQINIL